MIVYPLQSLFKRDSCQVADNNDVNKCLGVPSSTVALQTDRTRDQNNLDCVVESQYTALVIHFVNTIKLIMQ